MTGCDGRVRNAGLDDEPALLELCMALHQENGLLEVSEPRVRAMLRSALARENYSIIGVIGDAGKKLEGAVFLVMDQLWYSDQWCLSELFNYVRPEFRTTDNAGQLIKFARSAADNLKVPLLIGILSNERTVSKVRLYSRHLGPPAGAFFLYGGRTGAPSMGVN